MIADDHARWKSLARIVLLGATGMTAYEVIKQLFFPRLTLWQSHLMTIFVITVVIGVSAHFWIAHQTKLLDAVRQSESKYRSIFENAVEGIFQTTPLGGYISVNPALARMYGYDSPEDLMSAVRDIGHQIYVDPQRRIEFKELMSRHRVVQGFEYQVCRKDGHKLWLSENARAVCDADGGILYYEGTVEDITERKRLEEHLRQALKMDAVGRLAGGIAHDFNNLLTVIQGHSELIQERYEAAEPASKSADAIKKAAQTAASLTRQLLAFSRMQVIQPKALDLNAVLTEMGKMLPRLIREDIELDIKPGASLGQVKADPTQIEQIILNLVVNARDAMPQGGKLVIETRNEDLDEEYGKRHSGGVRPGKYAMLAVSDNGHGMDAETQRRIFEPFFTTKELGKRTRLGLATAYGIVKQSGGWIWVYSELARGTTFKIYLPRIERTGDQIPAREVHSALSHGTETILLVEDQDGIRELAREVLRVHGYNVLEARDGHDALQVVECHEGAIDLLVTDVVMPHVGGRELAGRLMLRYPRLKALYMTGYAEYSARGHGFLDENAAMLAKPFSTRALWQTVREVLDAAPLAPLV